MKKKFMPFLVLIILALISNSLLFAQFDFGQDEADGSRYIGGPRLGNSQIQIWRAGLVLEPGVSLENVLVTIPVPMNWREQRVININEEKMDARLSNQIEYNIINGGAMEMRLRFGSLRPTKPQEIVVAFEVENFELLPPEDTSRYIIPTKVPQEYRQYLSRSPTIESDNPIFSKMFAEITRGRTMDWDKVEALYSFVQSNVRYDNQAWRVPAKGALSVVKMPRGEWSADCKDMSCLFVALCRAGKIPARIVRVPEHCYAEFYLEMKQENTSSRNRGNTVPRGFWFPCQVSGDYAFGGIPEKRVILQKGDAFPDTDTDRRGKTLWLRESFQASRVISGQPKVRFVHDATIK